MFELEDDAALVNLKRKKTEDYDYGLAIALSRSIADATGNQILSPEEVQKLVNLRIEEIINKRHELSN